MTAVKAGDLTLDYEDQGSGAPVVLVHGFTLDRRMWAPQVPALLEAGYRVISYDLRGHGHSDAPESGYSHHDHADDLEALVAALNLPPFHVVGLSLGGGTAAEYAARHPEAIRSLTLIDAVLPGMAFSEETSGILGEVYETAAAQGHEAALAGPWRTSRLFHPTRDHPQNMAALLEMNAAFSGKPFFDRSRPPERTPLAERLGAVTAPALVIVGALDMPDFHTIGNAYIALLPNARLVTIAKAGHMSNMDEPEAVNRALIDFIHGADAPA